MNLKIIQNQDIKSSLILPVEKIVNRVINKWRSPDRTHCRSRPMNFLSENDEKNLKKSKT